MESLGNVLGGGYDDCTEKPLKKGNNLKDSAFVHNLTDNHFDNIFHLSAWCHRSIITQGAPRHVIIGVSLVSGHMKVAWCNDCNMEELCRCCHHRRNINGLAIPIFYFVVFGTRFTRKAFWELVQQQQQNNQNKQRSRCIKWQFVRLTKFV